LAASLRSPRKGETKIATFATIGQATKDENLQDLRGLAEQKDDNQAFSQWALVSKVYPCGVQAIVRCRLT
jgi:hypothetical protein